MQSGPVNNIVGHVESLWRYPVKSMCGEQLDQAQIAFGGVQGDRLYGFHDTAAPANFPYFTARQRPEMLLWRPALDQSGGAPRDGHAVEVRTQTGERLGIDDPRLIALLQDGLVQKPGAAPHGVSLMRSERAIADARPISLFSIQTAGQIAAELGRDIDRRRFRANLYLDLGDSPGFAEDAFVGRSLRIGPNAVVAVVERDPRCRMINLDPDTAEADPTVLRHIARAHEGKAGVYATVLAEGLVSLGDKVCLV